MKTNLIILISLLLFCTAEAGSATKPNIIYIMADELAYYEVGFMGGKEILTPNIDRLAAGGVIMKNLLSGGPNCAVARCALLTGKHTGHGSVRANSGNSAIRTDEMTIGEVLKPRGYAVAGFGKWGIGGRDSTGIPEKHGFDLFFGYYDQAHAHTYYPPYLIRNSADVPAEVDGISFLSDLIGEKAAGQMQKRHDYLYWEKGKWSAIRQGDWRAVNLGKHRWELYNVSDDPAESKDLAKANPEIVTKLSALAKQAHETERPGTYTTKERADRDRRRGSAEAKEK